MMDHYLLDQVVPGKKIKMANTSKVLEGWVQ